MSEAKRSRGRPSIKTPEVCAEIVDRLSKGEPLAQICRDEDMPHQTTVNRWVEEDPEFKIAFAHARVSGFDQIALDALQIADDGRNDEFTDPETGKTQERTDVIARSRLRVETRLKLLAKWDPKRYGDQLNINGAMELAHTYDPTKAADLLEQALAKAGLK